MAKIQFSIQVTSAGSDFPAQSFGSMTETSNPQYRQSKEMALVPTNGCLSAALKAKLDGVVQVPNKPGIGEWDPSVLPDFNIERKKGKLVATK